MIKAYKHGGYQAFKINDPKSRDIHKASVRDRLVHHALHRVLYPYFDRYFIHDSYSCRIGKGTHRAMNRFRSFARKVSKNHTRTAWALKCDIRKFFANIDHQILYKLLCDRIGDKDILWLLKNIIESFWVPACLPVGMASAGTTKRGLPLGNLTSQLLVNIYMNVFDQFMKRELKAQYYIRYADDFVILYHSQVELELIVLKIGEFLWDKLRLELHPGKLSITTFASGVDFLGWVHFPHHRVLRNATKWRMIRRLAKKFTEATIYSYRGMLSHGNAKKLQDLYL